MSIDKIGNMEQNVNIYQKQVAHKPPGSTDIEKDAVVRDTKKGSELTKISYPPFFPLGDTQGIFKK